MASDGKSRSQKRKNCFCISEVVIYGNNPFLLFFKAENSLKAFKENKQTTTKNLSLQRDGLQLDRKNKNSQYEIIDCQDDFVFEMNERIYFSRKLSQIKMFSMRNKGLF